MVAVVNIGSNTGVSVSSLAVTVPAGGVPASGQIIVALSFTGSLSSITDTAGNTYSQSQFITSGTTTTAIFRARSGLALSSGNSITATFTVPAAAAVAAFYALGLANVALDGGVTNAASGTSANPSVTASGSPGTAGELYVGVVGGASLTTSFTQDSTNAAWASPPGQVSLAAPVLGGGVYINPVASGTITYAPTFGSSDTWGAVIVAYIAAALPLDQFDWPNPHFPVEPSRAALTSQDEQKQFLPVPPIVVPRAPVRTATQPSSSFAPLMAQAGVISGFQPPPPPTAVPPPHRFPNPPSPDHAVALGAQATQGQLLPLIQPSLITLVARAPLYVRTRNDLSTSLLSFQFEPNVALLTAVPLSPPPFNYDWPNPRQHYKPQDQVVQVNVALQAASPKPPQLNTEFPNGPRYPKAEDFPQPYNVALLYTPPPVHPPLVFDWPNPRVYPKAQDHVYSLNVALLSAVAATVVPRAPLRVSPQPSSNFAPLRAQDGVQSGLTSAPPVTPPPPRFEPPHNPRPPHVNRSLFAHLPQLLPAGIPPILTLVARAPIYTRTQTASTFAAAHAQEGIGTATAITPPVFQSPRVVYEFPNPKQPSNVAALTAQVQQPSPNTLSQLPVQPLPFVWGNPPPPPRPASLLTHLASLRPTPAPQVPVGLTYDFPNPRPLASAAQSWLFPTSVALIATPAVKPASTNYDFQPPRQYPRPQDFVVPTSIALTATPAKPPQANYDWPVPRAYGKSQDAVYQSMVALFLAAPPSPPPYPPLWDNPRVYGRAQDTSPGTNVGLLSPSPVPPFNYDWPNPKTQSRPRDPVQHVDLALLVTPLTAPPPQVPTFPNPRIPLLPQAPTAATNTALLTSPQPLPPGRSEIAVPRAVDRPQDFVVQSGVALDQAEPALPSTGLIDWPNPRRQERAQDFANTVNAALLYPPPPPFGTHVASPREALMASSLRTWVQQSAALLNTAPQPVVVGDLSGLPRKVPTNAFLSFTGNPGAILLPPAVKPAPANYDQQAPVKVDRPKELLTWISATAALLSPPAQPQPPGIAAVSRPQPWVRPATTMDTSFNPALYSAELVAYARTQLTSMSGQTRLAAMMAQTVLN